MKRLLLFVLSLLFSASVSADVLTLRTGHPDSYVVQKGDTLWDISARFLQDPWRWPALWGVNPQIANPHLIYPGDHLTLVFIDGQPRLVNKPVFRRQPGGYVQPKQAAVPMVPLALIQPYLLQNRVVDGDWLLQQPVVLGGESSSRHHVTDDVVYVKGSLELGDKVGLYQTGRAFRDDVSDEFLGQEIILSATGRVIESGEISKVQLLSSFIETKAGFHAVPFDSNVLTSAYFMPSSGAVAGAKILASALDIREMGKLDIAYVDKGEQDGLTAGQVYTIFEQGKQILIDNDDMPRETIAQSAYDQLQASAGGDDVIQLPKLYRGQLMIFKVFAKTSMGIILVDKRPVRQGDLLFQPDVLLRDQ